MSTIKPEAKICTSCSESRAQAGLKPIEMIVLPNRTSKKKLVLRVCPNCDGEVGRIALKNSS